MIVYLTTKFYFPYLVAYSQWNKSVFRRVCGYHVVACYTMTILKCFDICDTYCVAGSWGYIWHTRYSIGIFCTTERHRKMQTTNGSIWGALRGVFPVSRSSSLVLPPENKSEHKDEMGVGATTRHRLNFKSHIPLGVAPISVSHQHQ